MSTVFLSCFNAFKPLHCALSLCDIDTSMDSHTKIVSDEGFSRNSYSKTYYAYACHLKSKKNSQVLLFLFTYNYDLILLIKLNYVQLF